MVPFTTSAGLSNALSAMQPGDYIFYNGGGVLTITGEYTGFANRNPSGVVVIDLGLRSSGNYVKFSYTGTLNLPAVWLHDSSNLRLYGGELTTNGVGGTALQLQAVLRNVLWWDFVSHDNGGAGAGLAPITPGGIASIIDSCWIRGEVYNWGGNLNWDPHAEAGTGIHGVNLADVRDNAGNCGSFTNNTIAFFAHDGPTGAACEFGNPSGAGGSIANNVLYLKGVNLTKVATSQVAGNVLQLWGAMPFTNTIVPWVEGINIQGRVVDGEGLSGATYVNGGKVTIQHGRHSNSNQNTHLGSTEPGVSAVQPYDDRWGITFQDCL